jgi:hypothetical protein
MYSFHGRVTNSTHLSGVWRPIEISHAITLLDKNGRRGNVFCIALHDSNH